jgi:hypothetical protein
MENLESSTARSLYADSKTGGNLRIEGTLQRGDYTVNPDTRRATFAKGNRGATPKVLQIKAREFIIKCCNGEAGVKKLIKKIYANALKGNFRAQELLLNYILGRPTEKIKIESADTNGIAYTPVVRIIADNLRLEKLNKDVDSAPVVVDPDRIKEMEDVLNRAAENSNVTPTVEEEPTPKKKRQKLKSKPTRKKR